jgi:hypothetical protein
LQHLDRKISKKLEMGITCDDYATHNHPAVEAYLMQRF